MHPRINCKSKEVLCCTSPKHDASLTFIIWNSDALCAFLLAFQPPGPPRLLRVGPSFSFPQTALSIRIGVLGAPRCFANGQELTELPAQKTRFALLVYLAIERNVSRDAVAAFFWPDSDDDRARHALSQALYELKRILGDGWLETQGGRLIVTNLCEVDCLEFNTSLQKGERAWALSLYRGAFLDGFFLPNNQQFENWIDRQRAQFERAHRKARRESMEAMLEAGNFTRAIDAARAWVEVDPLEDEANHRLIELLARSGARADALNAYASYERRLKDELDVEPLDHTRDLIRSIKENELPVVAIEPVDATPSGHLAVQLRWSLRRQRRRWVLVGAGFVAAIAFGMWSFAWPPFVGSSVHADTTRLVIFPFERDKGVRDSVDESTLLREAFGRWKGVTIVDGFQVQEALARADTPSTLRQWAGLSRELGAGRFVRTRITPLGDSSLIQAVMYDAGGRGRAIIDQTVRIPAQVTGAESILMQLAGNLLRVETASKASGTPLPTYSLPARRAFERAQQAIREWDLKRADAELTQTIQHDANYSEAYLWLAQTRSWLGYDAPQWASAAERAYDGRATLSVRDKGLATALVAMSRNDFGTACIQYRSLASSSLHDFSVWYGLADCLQRDERVEPDASSPSGWRFRASYHEAVRAYQRAFGLLPSIHNALRPDNFRVVRRLLKTQRTALRTGSRSGMGNYEFAAYAELRADTLVFIPYPTDEFDARPRDVRAVTAAVNHQRGVFREVASSWLAAYPSSAAAMEAVSLALELLGDPSALDTLVNARRIAREERDRVRLGVNEVFLRLKYSLPLDLNGVRRARTLADSLLRTQSPQTTPHATLLAALAVLTGRGEVALSFMRTSGAAESLEAPAVLRPALVPLLVFSSVGGPIDSLRVYEERLARLIDAALPGEERERARFEWMLRSSYLSLPVHHFQHLGSAAEGDTLIAAANLLQAAARKNIVNMLQPRRLARRDVPPSQLTLDVLYPETWILFAAGEHALAAEWIDPMLSSMHAWPPLDRAGELMDIGAWVRVMALRAEIAEKLGDKRSARMWARPVVALWSDSDKSLRPITRRMHELAK